MRYKFRAGCAQRPKTTCFVEKSVILLWHPTTGKQKVLTIHAMKARTITLEIIIALLVLLWVYAALSKWADYQAFYRQLAWNKVVGGYEDFLFYFLPGIELIAAIALILRPIRSIGLYLSTGLMLAFTGYVFYVVYIDQSKATCTCGGVISAMTWKQHLLFNATYLILSITGLILHRSILQPPTQNEHKLGVAENPSKE